MTIGYNKINASFMLTRQISVTPFAFSNVFESIHSSHLKRGKDSNVLAKAMKKANIAVYNVATLVCISTRNVNATRRENILTISIRPIGF